MKSFSELENDLLVKDLFNFLEKQKNIYWINNFPWTVYHDCLQPALHLPYETPDFDREKLVFYIQKNKYPFIRWSDSYTSKPTEWWWLICRKPFLEKKLDRNTRYKIRRGLSKCLVKIIDSRWLAENGYQCYQNAHKRYKNARLEDANSFKKSMTMKVGYDCFQFWGIFFDNQLVGYAECLLGGKMVFWSETRYDPDYLKHSISYALTFSILNYYLNQKDFDLITDGTRSIAHQTFMQKYLLKFNFQKEFCRLNIIYKLGWEKIINFLYLFKSIFNILDKIIPLNIFHKINVVLRQEKIKRSF